MGFSLTLEMRLLPIGGGDIARFFHFSLFRPFQNESMRLSVRVGPVHLAPIKSLMDTIVGMVSSIIECPIPYSLLRIRQGKNLYKKTVNKQSVNLKLCHALKV